MKRSLTATIAAIAFAAPFTGSLAAQDAQLSGTVAETFGEMIVVTTPDGRLLVTMPDGAEVPATGVRVDMSGTRDGETFAATELTVSSQAVADPAEAMLPQALRGLGLTDIRSRPDDDGETYYSARLPDDGWLRAEAQGDRLLEVQSDGVGLPDSLIVAILPEAIRSEPRFADIAMLTEIEIDDDGEITLEGYAADGMQIEMEFDRSFALSDFERERDDRRSLSEAAARERLQALGYTEVGFIERGGRHVEAVAMNPYGDEVEVRLDDQGRVERERLWLR